MIYWQSWDDAIHYFERNSLRGNVLRTVDCELAGAKIRIPVVLAWRHVTAQYLLQRTMISLTLTVGLRMIR